MSIEDGAYVQFQSEVKAEHSLVCSYQVSPGSYVYGYDSYYTYGNDNYLTSEGCVSSSQPPNPAYPCDYNTLCSATGPDGGPYPIADCSTTFACYQQTVTITNNSTDDVLVQWYPVGAYEPNCLVIYSGSFYTYSYGGTGGLGCGSSFVSQFCITKNDANAPCQLNCYGFYYNPYPPYDCLYSGPV